jgi:hypothetical protein
MKFPLWPPTSSSTSGGDWKMRSPCDGCCTFLGINVTTIAGSGRKPCLLRSSEQHTVTYRNIGGVSLPLTLSARGHRGIVFIETGKSQWSLPVTAISKGEWQSARREKVKRTVDTSAHPGGSGEIDFEFAIHDPGLLKQPSPVRLSFFI